MSDELKSDESKRIALVTGANKGIGFEVARQLAKAGCTVLMGARNLDLGQQSAAKLQAEKLDVRFLPLDLDNLETITAAVATIEAEFKVLDILVNNAGIIDHTDGPPTKTNVEAVERTMKTNFLGTLSVTQALLPLLHKSKSARIVNVSSGLGSITLSADPNWEYAANRYLGYAASKAALNMLTAQLSAELKDTAIKVNSSDPGYTATDLNNNQGHQTIEEGSAETIRLALLPDDGPTGTFSANAGPNPW
jgi:NAD(P)-dependent dehydrogenase (short-subunit alcohol dehydrogenase family)